MKKYEDPDIIRVGAAQPRNPPPPPKSQPLPPEPPTAKRSFTDAELRAHNERIIRATLEHFGVDPDEHPSDHDAIIAAAEADQ